METRLPHPPSITAIDQEYKMRHADRDSQLPAQLRTGRVMMARASRPLADLPTTKATVERLSRKINFKLLTDDNGNGEIISLDRSKFHQAKLIQDMIDDFGEDVVIPISQQYSQTFREVYAAVDIKSAAAAVTITQPSDSTRVAQHLVNCFVLANYLEDSSYFRSLVNTLFNFWGILYSQFKQIDMSYELQVTIAVNFPFLLLPDSLLQNKHFMMRWLSHNGLVVGCSVSEATTVTINETGLTDRANKLVRYHSNELNINRQSNSGFVAAEELGNDNGSNTAISLISYREDSVHGFYSLVGGGSSATYICDTSADFPIRNLILKGKRQGLHHFYLANSSKLVSKGHYVDHQQHGLWHHYGKQGKVGRLDNFESGRLLWSLAYHDPRQPTATVGLVTAVSAATLVTYHEDGTEIRQRYNRDGNLECQASYKSKLVAGQVVVSVCSRDGQLHGPYEEWSEYRKLRFKGDYVDGQRHGSWSEFYGSTGQLKSVKNYVAGIVTGPYREYHFNGDIAVTGQHLNKERDGVWLWYRPGNIPEKKLGYKNGVLDGDYADFDEQGQLLEFGVYSQGGKIVSEESAPHS